MLSDLIYSRDASGRTRSWQFEVEGDKWRTHTGLVDGQKVASGWTTATPKNVGKKNATTAEDQARAEAIADRVKKLDRDYRQTIAELDGVPPSPMLAETYGKRLNPHSFPCYAQPKLDGIRALTTSAGAFSRQYQEHKAVDHIRDALREFFVEYPTVTLDGELYNHDLKDDFNQISSAVRRGVSKPADRERAERLVQLHVYDMFDSAHPDMPFGERCQFLADTFGELVGEDGPIRLVYTPFVISQDELDALYSAWMADGFEGQMVRMDGPYEVDKRSKLLLKRKEFITEEYEIVDIQEGNGNWAGYAKRVVLRLADGTTNEAGMRGTQTFARELLADKGAYIGGQATVRYFGVTPDGKLRMPVVVDFHKGARVD